MIDLIVVLFLMIGIGALIYIIKFKGKGIPKVGVKRENPSDYFKDYWDLKLYMASIGFIFLGSITLIVILILKIVSG